MSNINNRIKLYNKCKFWGKNDMSYVTFIKTYFDLPFFFFTLYTKLKQMS